MSVEKDKSKKLKLTQDRLASVLALMLALPIHLGVVLGCHGSVGTERRIADVSEGFSYYL